MTLHRLLYKPIFLPSGEVKFVKKTSLEYQIVIVDEISMAPKNMMDLLARFPVHIICCGDPAQLPPVSKENDNHLLDNPDIFLDEIMRQEAESEIIQLSMLIREGKPIPKMNGQEVQVLDRAELNIGMLLWADQVLTATNKMRFLVNQQSRQALGLEGPPQEGDKVICTRNYWEEEGNNGRILVNGTIGYLKNIKETKVNFPKFTKIKSISTLHADIENNYNIFSNLIIDKNMITTEEPALDNKQKYILAKKYSDLIPKEFVYGYAITTHRAQGSEWAKVLIIEENFPFDKEEHKRWLYTAVTRATSKLVLVR